jgi:hypothetical protein
VRELRHFQNANPRDLSSDWRLTKEKCPLLLQTTVSQTHTIHKAVLSRANGPGAYPTVVTEMLIVDRFNTTGHKKLSFAQQRDGNGCAGGRRRGNGER